MNSSKTYKIIIFIFIFYSQGINSQNIVWDKTFGGEGREYLSDAQATQDFGFILAGSSASRKDINKTESSHGDLDYWIWKMDEHGELEWEKSIGGNLEDRLQCIQHNLLGYTLGGISYSPIGEFKTTPLYGLGDIWVIHLDPFGKIEWQKTYGGSQEELISVLQNTPDGGYIIGGSSASDSSGVKSEKARGAMDYWIIKINKVGDIEWQKTFGGHAVDLLRTIVCTADGGYLVGGYSNSPISGDKTYPCHGNGDYWILKLNAKGELEWQKTIGGSLDDQLTSVILLPNGNYLLGGHSNSPISDQKNKENTNGTDIWLVSINTNGDILWQETYNIGQIDLLSSISVGKDKKITLGCYTQYSYTTGNMDGEEDYALIALNTDGKEDWRHIVGSSGDDRLTKSIETRDGGYLMVGTSNGKKSRDKSTTSQGYDFWAVKIRENNKQEIAKPIIEAAPNPTNNFSNIIIGYDYEEGSIGIFDIAGKQLFASTIKKSRTIPLDFSKYMTGVYIVEVKTNVQTNSVKIQKIENYETK